MLYDNYEKKIKKVAKAKNFVLRYKIIILSFLGLLIVSLGTFIGLKGLFTCNLEINDVTYGTEISLNRKPSALFSDYIIEYQKVDSNSWSQLKPVESGYYEARAVSSGVFGKRYSKSIKFEIEKAPIIPKLKLENLFYGDIPDLAFTLVNGDTVVKDSYSITYEKFEESVAYGTVHLKNLQILDINKRDVTSSYSFAENIEFTVNYKPQELFINLLDIKDYIYDAKEFSKEKLTYSLNKELLTGEKLTFDYEIISSDGLNYTNETLNVGTYKLNLKNIKVMNDSLDVSENYIIHSKEYEFKVNKKDLLITTGSSSKEYDGKELTDLNFDSNGLLDGQSINVLTNVNITNVGNIENKIEVEILNKDNENVSKNYNIIYEYGNLEILKRKVNIKLLPIESKIYDGIEINYLDDFNNFILLNDTSLVENEKLKVKVSFVNDYLALDSAKNAGIYQVQVKDFVGENLDFNNYDIEYTEESFEIYKRKVTISPQNIKDRIYNKKEFIYADEYQSSPLILEGNLVNDAVINIDVLFKVNGLNTICKDVDSYETIISNFNISNDLESNYDIKLESISFNVLPLDVDITILDVKTTYNGLNFDTNNISYQTSVEVNPLTFSYEFIDSKGNSLKEVLNADTYKINVTNILIEGDLVKNYNFNVLEDQRTLKINKAPLRITPSIDKFSKVYDGVVYKHESYDILAGEIFDDDIIYVTNFKYYLSDNLAVEVLPLNAGVYKYVCSEFEYINTLSTNYEIVVEFSDLEILKREVRVKILDSTMEYNGSLFEYSSEKNNFEYEINTEYRLVDGEFITLNVKYYQNEVETSPKNAGDYIIRLDSISYINALESNYNILVFDGRLEITPRKLTISLKPAESKIYDGNNYIYHNEYDIVSGSIVTGESININVKYINVETKEESLFIFNAGKYEIVVDYYTFENTLASNYNIEAKSVIVEILKAKLTVSPVDLSDKTFDYKIYDYLEINNNRAFIVKGKLVNDDKLEINVKFKTELTDELVYTDPLDVNTYYAYIDNHYFTTGLDSNYDVIYQNGKVLNILKKNVNVEVKDDSKIYDGINYDFNNLKYLVDDDRLVGYLDMTYEFMIDSISVNPLNAGIYNINVKNIVVNNYKQNNYNFNFNTDATLTISRRTVGIKISTSRKMYDGNAFNNFELILTEGSLVNNDNIVINSIKVTNLSSNNVEDAINVGSYLVEITNYSFTSGLESNYIVKLETTNLEIIKRAVRLKINDFEKVYDGLEFIYDNQYTYLPESLELLNGDKIKLHVTYNFNNNILSPVDARKYIIKFDYVEGLNGTNLDNYEFEVYDGTLNILKRELNITLSNASKEYDGSYLDYNNYIVKDGDLIMNHQLKLTFEFFDKFSKKYSEIKDAGIYNVAISSFDIINGNKDNYKLNYDSISVEILKRKVTLTNKHLEQIEYNGLEYEYSNFYGNEYTVLSGSLVKGESIFFNVKFTKELLSENYIRPKNVGTYYAKLSVSADNINLNNYDFELIENEELIIYKTNLIINFRENRKVYDGMPYIHEQIQYDIICNLNPMFNFTYNFSLNDQILNEIIDANTYKLNVVDYEIINDLSDNYNIMINTNNILISPAKIKVTPFDSTNNKIFDGKEFIYQNIYIEGNVGGDDIIRAKSFKFYKDNIIVNRIVDAGIYNIEVGELEFINTLPSNYEIDYTNRSTFEVLKRDIVIKPIDKVKVFDNEQTIFDRFENNFEYVNDSLHLVNDDSLVLDVYTVDILIAIDTGVYNINANYSFIKGLEQNYNVKIKNGTLTINKLRVDVTVKELVDRVYNGLPYIYEKEEFRISDLTNINSNDIFTLNLYFRNQNSVEVDQVLEANTYYLNRFTENFIVGNNDNYEINIINMNYSFKVLKAKLTVQTFDEVSTYQGYEKPFETNNIYNSDILSTDSIIFEKTIHHFAGTYDNSVKAVITNENTGTDVTNCYDIEYIFGKVTINKVDLFINYEGQYLELVYGYAESQLHLNCDVSQTPEEIYLNRSWKYYDFDTNLEVKNIFLVGHYKLRLVVDNIMYKDINVSKNYNVIINNNVIINDVYKELIVTKRDMTFESLSKEFDYNPNSKQDYKNGYKQTNLAAGDRIEIYEYPTIQMPSRVDNILKYHIYRGNVDVTSCYNITEKFGTLYIDNNLFIQTIDVGTYNGKVFNSTFEEVPVSIKKKAINDLKIIITFRDYLKDNISQKLKNAGLYIGIVDHYELKYVNTLYQGEEISKYLNSWDIHLDSINLEIKQYQLDLKAKNIEKIYDGLLFEDNVNNYEVISKNKVFEGHRVEVKTNLNSFNMIDRKTQKYQIESVNIYDENNIDITTNYKVIFRDDNERENKKYLGYARILPRKVYLETGSVTKVYQDGETLSCNEVEILNIDEPETGLLEGHTWEIDLDSCVLRRVGKRLNRVRIKIYDDNKKDISNNYRLDYTYCTGYLEFI